MSSESRVHPISRLACAMAIALAPAVCVAGVVQQVSPTPTTYLSGTDFLTMAWSVSADVTAQLQAVDVTIPPPGGSTSGCEAADFAGFVSGRIALIQRGTCSFRTKALNAQAVGAVGVFIFNEGNTPAREPVFAGTLGGPGVLIPVVATSFFFGRDLYNETLSGPVVMHMFVGANTWIGLKNSDDVGLRVDLKVEGFLNSVPFLSGKLDNQSTGSSGFNNALLKSILEAGDGLPDLVSGDEVSFNVSVRRTCSGTGHNSGTVRLWYNGAAVDSGATRDAGSRFDTIGSLAGELYLLSGFTLDSIPGSPRIFADAHVDSSAPCPGRPYVVIGTWSVTVS